jgi:hypothetical protein
MSLIYLIDNWFNLEQNYLEEIIQKLYFLNKHDLYKDNEEIKKQLERIYLLKVRDLIHEKFNS